MITEGFSFEMLALMMVAVIMIIALIKEWISPDVVAMSTMCLLLLLGILDSGEALKVFSNEAPITIAAMFILSAALEETGSLNRFAHWLGNHLGSNLRLIIFFIMAMVGGWSAFMNNTPVVAIMMPILLTFARTAQISPSKLLIPLSFAAVLGGCCTLIGTSTNILVSGMLPHYGLQPLSMFDLTWIGVPFLIVGTIYMCTVGIKLLPDHQSITSLLDPAERQMTFCQIMLRSNSPLIGKRLAETPLGSGQTRFRIIEIRRDGEDLLIPLDQIILKKYDRILLAMAHGPSITDAEVVDGTQKKDFEAWGVDNLAIVKGGIMEAVVSAHSHLQGSTLQSINFRQKYGMIALAVHRDGRNLSQNFQDVALEFGDTLLLLGPYNSFNEARETGDFVLLQDYEWKNKTNFQVWFPWIVLLLVVGVSSFGYPIVIASIMGCCLLMLTKSISPEKAYRSIDWQIIMMIYGMLGFGAALEKTGTAAWMANSLVHSLEMATAPEWLPWIALSFCYLMTSIFTEFMSNNATAVVMLPICINLANFIGVDPMPFVIAVTIASSAAFATPIGYQTNTMVYGAGGYRFSDFIRVGLPMNIIYWLMASFIIPLIWKF